MVLLFQEHLLHVILSLQAVFFLAANLFALCQQRKFSVIFILVVEVKVDVSKERTRILCEVSPTGR